MQRSVSEHLPSQVLRALDVRGSYKVRPLAGNENDNYLVETTDRAVVVKRLHAAYSVAETEAEGMYRSRLARVGLPVAPYLSLDGSRFVLVVDGEKYVATPYVRGTVSAYSQELAVQTAEILARVHSVNAVGLDGRDTWFRGGYIPDALPRIGDQYVEAKYAFADALNHLPDLWHSDLPRGIVHGDLHNENIIVDNEGTVVSVIDWEEAAVQPLLLDVALAVRFMSFRKDVCNEAIFYAFMDAYQKVRPLDEHEKELLEPALNYTALILSVWAHLKYSEGRIDQETFVDLGSRYRLTYVVPSIR